MTIVTIFFIMLALISVHKGISHHIRFMELLRTGRPRHEKVMRALDVGVVSYCIAASSLATIALGFLVYS